MKEKLLIGFNLVLAFAVVLLFLLYRSVKHPKDQVTTAKTTEESTPVPSGAFLVAYINTDSLLNKYELYPRLKETLHSKQAKSEGEYSRQMKQLEDDFNQYQEKAQKGLLTRSEMQEKEMSLQQRQQELNILNQKLSEELAQEEQEVQQQLVDSMKIATRIFNTGNRYQLIINNTFGSTIIAGNARLNVTDSIVTIMNARYKHSMSK